MNFGEAIKSGFSNYVMFSGRAGRSEYWFWVLFTVIGAIVAMIIDAALLGYDPGTASPIASIRARSRTGATRRLRRASWLLLVGVGPVA